MMVTVGVRELKRDAARLVQRASRGDRVLVTRYGKPAAQLVPAEIGSGRAESPRMRAWERERASFARLEPRLRRRYRGRWVGLRGGKVIGVGGDPQALARRLFRRLRTEAFFVGRVGAPDARNDGDGACPRAAEQSSQARRRLTKSVTISTSRVE